MIHAIALRVSGCTAIACRPFQRDRPGSEGGETEMKAIVIGIMPQDKIQERVLSIARGEHKPKSGEPENLVHLNALSRRGVER